MPIIIHPGMSLRGPGQKPVTSPVLSHAADMDVNVNELQSMLPQSASREPKWNVLSVRKFDSTGSVKGQSCSFYKSNERYQSVSEAVITAPYLPRGNDHRVFILHTEVCHQYLWMLQSSLWHILAGCDN